MRSVEIYRIYWLIILVLFSVAQAKDLKKACLENNASACYQHALPMVSGENAKVQDIKEEGMAYIRKACILGEHKACDIMGESYFSNASYIAALPYLKESCKRGVKSACESVGTIYRDGHDVKQDDVQARVFYEKACVLKSPDACHNVAIMYRGGFGVKKNRMMEKSFYQKGCQIGLQVSCEQFTILDNEDKGIKTGWWESLKSWFSNNNKR